MKQGKLQFPSSKRTASATKAKKAVDTIKNKSSDEPAHDHSIQEVKSSVSKYQKEGEDNTKKRITRNSSGSYQEPAKQEPSSDQDQIQPEPRPELNIKDAKWRKLFADAKRKRNGLPLVHGNKEDEISQILRVFDLNYDYGPCIGVSRLERWERAHALGLNPPPEIHDILSTRQGLEKYSDCVFHEEV